MTDTLLARHNQRLRLLKATRDENNIHIRALEREDLPPRDREWHLQWFAVGNLDIWELERQCNRENIELLEAIEDDDYMSLCFRFPAITAKTKVAHAAYTPSMGKFFYIREPTEPEWRNVDLSVAPSLIAKSLRVPITRINHGLHCGYVEGFDIVVVAKDSR